MRHEAITEEQRDTILLHALGQLDAGAAEHLELHIASGCTTCSDELRECREALGLLATLAATPPPEGLKQRLEAPQRCAAPAPASPQIWKRWSAAPAAGIQQLRAADGAWERTGVPGIEARRLSLDPERRGITMLVRMAPGTRYPGHRHGGREECYVLEGDLRHGEQVLGPGDYEVAPTGSTHGVQSTEHGCLLLIHSSLDDELLHENA